MRPRPHHTEVGGDKGERGKEGGRREEWRRRDSDDSKLKLDNDLGQQRGPICCQLRLEMQPVPGKVERRCPAALTGCIKCVL